MGDAFRCDRCDTFEDGRPVAKTKLITPRAENPDLKREREVELCSRCLASLTDWLDQYRRDLNRVTHD